MATGVYCIQNLANGKVYVGSAAKSLVKRMIAHRYYLKRGEHTNEHLQSSWNKYGKDGFVFFILEECRPEECLKKEQEWIDTFNACDRENGYNKAPVAGSPLGYKHTDEARARMSAATKGKKKTPEHAANIKAGKQGVTDETKTKMAEYASNRTDDHLAKLSDAMKGNKNCLGRVLSKESKEKLSKSIAEVWAKRKELAIERHRYAVAKAPPVRVLGGNT